MCLLDYFFLYFIGFILFYFILLLLLFSLMWEGTCIGKRERFLTRCQCVGSSLLLLLFFFLFFCCCCWWWPLMRPFLHRMASGRSLWDFRCVCRNLRRGRRGRRGGSPRLLFSFPPFPTAVQRRRRRKGETKRKKKRINFYKGPEEGEKW
ncbi:hypothetical protein Tc00.1047053505163.50 [Trypanosoma cruzi]|uniref:Uncharacterized protein n=1 Tax=Trypanosoma cruzi (strain CL Brener) TaxID=353153 RepID=Q4D2D2_TRYCC|nr:hypothetical protein Tc00.1047053505163.50 [Trypanosoma cruzi]EAN86685.1 hypothetical protein Tc00.1047053505163.50 [Trypanosoma cruzi]|eukprot:XP_808536.1 hypothetical protein [Trypanosoma cruzi strain CL Brener]